MSLRNGKQAISVSPANEVPRQSTAAPMSAVPPGRPSPYLLLVYPVLLALGSLYSQISPVAAQHAHAHGYTQPLAPGVTSDLNVPPLPSTPINYFAGKRNAINVYFVKFGWFWTTLAFALVQLTVRSLTSTGQRAQHYTQALLRYGIVTLFWIFTTQWFFGTPLFDRSFVLTGGHCEAVPNPVHPMTTAQLNELPTLSSELQCKASGGTWRGGHDISGHVFMLVLSSAFLLYELYLSDRHTQHPSISPRAAQNISQSMTEKEREEIGGFESETTAKRRVWVRYFLYTVVALDFWMLMMTAIWFHTWLEKLSGLLIAGAALYTTYFLGDFVPGWRDLVGGL